MDNDHLWIVQFGPAQGVTHGAPLRSIVERNVVELVGVVKPRPESEQWVTIGMARGYERTHLLAHDFKVRWRARWPRFHSARSSALGRPNSAVTLIRT